MKTLFLIILAVFLQNPELSQAENRQVMFSSRPIWTSGSAHCGGDGNARLLDVDLDGDLDLVTSAPNPRRWVLFKNVNGRLASEPFWNSKETTDCDHISVLDFDKDGLPVLAEVYYSEHKSLGGARLPFKMNRATDRRKNENNTINSNDRLLGTSCSSLGCAHQHCFHPGR